MQERKKRTYVFDSNEGLKETTGINAEAPGSSDIEKEIVKQNETPKTEETPKDTPVLKKEEPQKAPEEEKKEEAPKAATAPPEEKKEEAKEETPKEDKPSVENSAYYMALQLRSDGALPEEFEVPEEISYPDIYAAYKDSIESNVYEEVQTQFAQELKNQGVTREELLYARAIHNGIDPNMLSEVSLHRAYSSLDEEATGIEKKKEAIAAMHKSRGLSDTESAGLINVSEANDKLDELFVTAKGYHKDKFEEFEKQEKEYYKSLEDYREEAKRASEKAIADILEKREVVTQKLTKKQASQLRKDIYESTETVTIQGQEHRASKVQKFLLEFQNNAEVQLFSYLSWLNSSENAVNLKEEAKNELEGEFLREYGNIIKGQGSTEKKEETKKEQKAPTKKKTYFVDLMG
jgi:hypothetical protein